jgi:hypothetical protein
MNMSPVVDKTVFIGTNSGQIKVATLPEQIRYEVDTLDRINQKRLDIVCELEIIDLAIHSQKQRLNQLIKTIYPETPQVTEPDYPVEAIDEKAS